MARKPTGRPRGRPRGWRRYWTDDQLGIEMARLILSGRAKDFPDAIHQVADKADGPNTERSSKVRRLKRLCDRRGDWFFLQAKARPTPARAGSIAGLLGISPAIQDMIASQERFARMANQIRRSPLLEFARHLEEQQHSFERTARQMEATLRLGGAN